jgi:hypothetical protein
MSKALESDRTRNKARDTGLQGRSPSTRGQVLTGDATRPAFCMKGVVHQSSVKGGAAKASSKADPSEADRQPSCARYGQLPSNERGRPSRTRSGAHQSDVPNEGSSTRSEVLQYNMRKESTTTRSKVHDSSAQGPRPSAMSKVPPGEVQRRLPQREARHIRARRSEAPARGARYASSPCNERPSA